MRWKILAMLCLGLACASDGFCGTPVGQSIVFIPKASDHQFWQRMHEGADRAVTELGNVTLTWRGPAHSGDVDAQIRILENYTYKGVDAIVLAPIDRSRLELPVKTAVDMGIRVIVVDSELNGKNHSHFIGTDNFAAGALAASQIEKLLGNKGRLVVVRTYKGSVSVEDRVAGFLKHLSSNAPQVQVAADFYTGDAPGNIYSITKRTLQQVQKFDAVFAPNETTALAALRALRDLGLAGAVRFVGFDATPLLIEAVRQREISGLVLQDPYQIGYLGVKAAVAPPNTIAGGNPVVNHIPATLVTLENIDLPAVQDLITRGMPQQ